MIKDCPKIRRKNNRTRFKPKRADKRSMVATWSDRDSFASESEDKKSLTSISWVGKAQ